MNDVILPAVNAAASLLVCGHAVGALAVSGPSGHVVEWLGYLVLAIGAFGLFIFPPASAWYVFAVAGLATVWRFRR